MGKFKTEGKDYYHLANSSADAWLSCTTENLIMWICSSYFFCFSLFTLRDSKGFRCHLFQPLLVANPKSIIIAVAASLGDSLLAASIALLICNPKGWGFCSGTNRLLTSCANKSEMLSPVVVCVRFACVLFTWLIVLKTEAEWPGGFVLSSAK